MNETIRNLLQRLYGPEQKTLIDEQLATLAKKCRIVHHEKPLFCEKDVVLITYGDTMRGSGASPLQTMNQFAQTRLKGVISTIHILPFFPYSSDDGFSVTDYYAVNPDLGEWQDIVTLAQNFDLMFDAVFNHMSAQSAWFRAFLDGDPDFAGMFITESPMTDLSSVTRPRATPLLTPFTNAHGETVHVWTTFSADQVDFDVRHPETLLRLLDVLLFYIEQGASIIRLDAIAYLWKQIGTPSIHLEEVHLVIQLMRAVLDVVAPHVILITETNVPHQENVSYFGDGYNEAQLVYNFTLPPLLFHTLLSSDATKLRQWVNTLTTPSDRTTFFNFTASHDGIGVRPVEGILDADELQRLIDRVQAHGGRVSYKANPDGSQSPYELNIAYVDALTNPAEPIHMQVDRFMASQAIMLALAGMPAIYVHSLLGSRNDIEGMLETGRSRTINRAKLNVDAVNSQLDDAQTFRAQVFERYMHLIKTRIAHPAFHPNAEQSAPDTGNPGVFALQRTAAEEQITVLVNVTGEPQAVSIEAATDILTGESFPAAKLQLEAYEVRWLLARRG